MEQEGEKLKLGEEKRWEKEERNEGRKKKDREGQVRARL